MAAFALYRTWDGGIKFSLFRLPAIVEPGCVMEIVQLTQEQRNALLEHQLATALRLLIEFGRQRDDARTELSDMRTRLREAELLSVCREESHVPEL